MTAPAWGLVLFFCSLVWVGTLVGAVTLKAVFYRRVTGTTEKNQEGFSQAHALGLVNGWASERKQLKVRSFVHFIFSRSLVRARHASPAAGH
jgi:hypothetical protein